MAPPKHLSASTAGGQEKNWEAIASNKARLSDISDMAVPENNSETDMQASMEVTSSQLMHRTTSSYEPVVKPVARKLLITSNGWPPSLGEALCREILTKHGNRTRTVCTTLSVGLASQFGDYGPTRAIEAPLVTPMPSGACTPLKNSADVTGKIAIIDRIALASWTCDSKACDWSGFEEGIDWA